jgi:phosphonatase-like hydrolase
MAIELVVFDVAGTTVTDDFAVGRTFERALAEGDIQVTRDEITEVMGLAKPQAIRTLAASRVDPGALDEKVVAIHRRFVALMVEHYATAASVEPIPGAEATFAALRARGIAVALDTGFDRAILDAVLRRLGWSSVLDATVASDEVARGRPHPDMIHRVMQQLFIHDEANVWKVGDTVVDILEGRAAGCGASIGVTSGTGSAAALARAGATWVVRDLTVVVDLLDGVSPRKLRRAG